MSGGTPDGAALRRDFDARCTRVAAEVQQAQTAATAAGDAPLARFFASQLNGIRALQASADGRRALPGSGTGLLHDIPPAAAEPAYAKALEALDELTSWWLEGLRVPNWDWRRDGYPPGWASGLGDRLRAGIFYRRR